MTQAETFNRAMDAIRDEMAKAGSMEVTNMGELMTALLEVRPDIAEKVAAKGKNLAGAFEALKAYARKKAKNGFYGFGPGNLGGMFEAVGGYYGVKVAEENYPDVMVRLFANPQTSAGMAAAAKAPEKDDLDLDALLGVL